MWATTGSIFPRTRTEEGRTKLLGISFCGSSRAVVAVTFSVPWTRSQRAIQRFSIVPLRKKISRGVPANGAASNPLAVHRNSRNSRTLPNAPSLVRILMSWIGMFVVILVSRSIRESLRNCSG